MVALKTLLGERTVVMGVGSLLKKDDALGPLIISKLIDRGFVKYPLIDAGTTPENYIGKIAGLEPDLLLIIDAADFGAAPGTIALFNSAEILLKGFSTHDLSLKTFAEHLVQIIPVLQVLVLGVQPEAVGFGEGLSPPVNLAMEQIVGQFIALQ
ncbi:MAG: hydrogenase 3 maturation endopeptidase HyCI [Candidatus Margulisbacteria bacterium]|nr:hydrogenase 3 maturation endopeptidase HyCI [Candidatus Margulisiibacteriota bacterium]MBU1617716.1 hydrogenase 3 maturation endopeptidase HyCI [Candidatus Margulisiibacteriota bacterium]MBU1866849.1 hydrogenase 3 maturation endopeptidase HyCI [Candidatus Margulisiibacteriota bacterium]